ncbi:SH3 domain-containing protein 21 [Strigops habroptila]|uniref:SH3 domain-containing protein 21 n=1 Tax=Strigops habroptila TaxID=2489341 RepID=UPI0011CFE242|nr:SH3 domain-containing protein 21 [Strigops habroptila]
MHRPLPAPEDEAEPCPAAQRSAPILQPEPDPEPRLCRALFDYSPELPDELPLRQGDVIQVLSKHTGVEGWWDGQCRHRGGLFPSNFVELLPVSTLKPAMPSWDAESNESGQDGHPAPVPSVSHRAAPRPGVRWVGAAQEPAVPGGRRSPVGSEDVAWTSTEMLSTSTSFPARFPPASRARCGVAAAGGAGHSTAPLGLRGSPAPAAACKTAKDEEGEHLKLAAPLGMEPAKQPPSKRMAPAPPVPAKAKPAPAMTSKPGGPQPCASDTERGRAGDADADGFNVVPVTTARLSHPTATRPRVPGQRPPSLTPGGAGGPCSGDQPRGTPHTSAGQAPAPPWSTEVLVAPCPKETLALEHLKAEVRSLHLLVDLMRVQHLRDLEDVRLELGQERAKRQALQAEIELVRKVLPC